MQINIPNIPNLFGKLVGTVAAQPLKLGKGVVEGFKGALHDDEHTQVDTVGEPSPTKPSFAKDQ